MAVVDYERSYLTARSTLGLLEFIGWAAVIAGVICAFAGFATGGLIGLFGRDPPMAARLISTIPGLLLSLSALFAICWVQVSRVNVDTAEMTREMLRLTRGGNALPRGAYSGVAESAVADPARAALPRPFPFQRVDMKDATISKIGDKYRMRRSRPIGISLAVGNDGTFR